MDKSNHNEIKQNESNDQIKKPSRRGRKRKLKVYKIFSSDSENEEKNEKLENMSVFKVYSEMKQISKEQEEKIKTYQDIVDLGTQLKERIAADEEKDKEYYKKLTDYENQNRDFVVKDCKYLTDAELKQRFQADIKWIEDTFYGRRYCERHERYKRENVKHRLTSKDLMYNVSCEVFTDNQLIYLCRLFRSKFDKGKLWKYANYYWKVLLPEYCLKIFMDCYNLEYKEAMDYLNDIPIPIERYFQIINKLDKRRRKPNTGTTKKTG